MFSTDPPTYRGRWFLTLLYWIVIIEGILGETGHLFILGKPDHVDLTREDQYIVGMVLVAAALVVLCIKYVADAIVEEIRNAR